MAEAGGGISAIAWRELFPWWLLFRVFRLAISPSVLVLATIATALTPVGWRCAEALFLPENIGTTDPEFAQLSRGLSRFPAQSSLRQRTLSAWRDGSVFEQPVTYLWQLAVGHFRTVYARLVVPFRQFLTPGQALSKYAYLLFGCLWTLLVWSFFGGAITRIAAVRFGPEQRMGLTEAVRYVARRFPSYFMAPLFPLLAVAAIVLLSLPLGLLMRLDVGILVAGVLWILMLLAGLALGVLMLGLLLGWPLMWPTISSEESGDVFEATQRCYSYTFDRPLNYLLYAGLAFLLGGLGWIFVLVFSEAVIELGFWAVAWGAGTARVERVGTAVAGGDVLSGAAGLGSMMIGWSVAVARTVAGSYLYAYFWCATSAIYLLLRYDVDQTELDEVHLDEELERFGLPPLEVDSAGVPGVAESEAGSSAGATARQQATAPDAPAGEAAVETPAEGTSRPADRAGPEI